MDEKIISVVRNRIMYLLGAKLNGAVNYVGERKSVDFWFESYTRSDGPVFNMSPKGLKRHFIRVSFGPYASPCIKHINHYNTPQRNVLVISLLNKLKETQHVNIIGVGSDWVINENFSIDVYRTVDEVKSKEELNKTIDELLTPLVALMLELIGYEYLDGEEKDKLIKEEGSVYFSTIKKRERNPQNRFLSLMIHGDKCKICGFDPKNFYAEEVQNILEVHHIEPLSEIDFPKIYDPEKDLIPLCPNCHRALHTKKPAYTPDELKALLKYDN